MGNHSLLDEFRAVDSPLVRSLNAIFDGIYVTDRKRTIVFWNKGAEEITGYTAAEVLGRCCKDDILNHIDENGTLLCRSNCPLTEVLNTGKEIRAKVYPLHASGRRFPVMTHIAPLTDDGGEVVGAIEVFRDVTQEEEFRRLQEKFNALIKKYVSTATMEQVMTDIHSGPQDRARMRDMTVLYLDVVGYTSFAESHAPDETVRMLNDLFGICEVITREHHGDIDKYIGDAVMAVFIDANDAVDAAISILEALEKFNVIRQDEGMDAIAVRIGMNSGILMQGEIGAAERKDVTVIGDVVNTASRIESATPPLSICISEATHSRLRDTAPFESFQTIHAKNRKEPVKMFRFRST